ncbi:MAG: hypothetical protein UT08_C0003G0041 [Candidatus Woesebacteria bacterium GW2011_GWB1_38_8]|uniref:Methyltransferase small domain-containing protein n=1 Tax=Candidatus Woesebacteria bacterium GW2011_GWB1_38_8 TaxID=1618570 RepID=A0A0G0L1N0_9BACT|nr:MAG: hypothetical protein UT08_C0003G0041 [Candidatus Woesebacteria bacterium GW2011_GWB1_38_8]
MTVSIPFLGKNIILENNEAIFMPSKRSLLIAEILKNFDIKNKSLLDVGCGSGFLSIVSAKLGAKEVVASDISPVSILATRKNWELNQLDSNLTTLLSDRFEQFEKNKWGNHFNFIISNPPALPSAIINDEKLDSFQSWMWNLAGKDGRLVTNSLIINSPDFLVKEGKLVFCESSRQNFDKTNRLLKTHFKEFEILTELKIELEDRFLPFLKFWNKKEGMIVKENGKFFEIMRIIKAVK